MATTSAFLTHGIPRSSPEGAGFCSHSSRRKVACNVPPPRGGRAGIPAGLCLTQRPRHRAGPVPASTGCTFHNDTTAVPPESLTLLHSTQFSVTEVGFLPLRLPHPCTHHTGTRPRGAIYRSPRRSTRLARTSPPLPHPCLASAACPGQPRVWSHGPHRAPPIFQRNRLHVVPLSSCLEEGISLRLPPDSS